MSAALGQTVEIGVNRPQFVELVLQVADIGGLNRQQRRRAGTFHPGEYLPRAAPVDRDLEAELPELGAVARGEGTQLGRRQGDAVPAEIVQARSTVREHLVGVAEQPRGECRGQPTAQADQDRASAGEVGGAAEQADRHIAAPDHAVLDDPALAVGSAKELIESTAKVVPKERGQPVDDKDDLPALVRSAQQALGLHPSSKAPGPDGSDAIKKILGSVSGIAIGLAELRNRGYGPATAPVGLGPRHAHLAVNAAFTWCQLMLDTLTDPKAPSRKELTRSQPERH